MDAQPKPRREGTTRAGAYALTLLASPLNVCILRALEEGPASLAALRQAAGSAPQTTVRNRLSCLTELGIVARERSAVAAGYELLKPGRELIRVVRTLEEWLGRHPTGPLELTTVVAKSAIKALVGGWTTTLLRALSARPLSLTQLDALISGISYPSLDRRLVAMRMAGQVEAREAPGRGTPYAVTPWLRQAVGPLTCAARWERRHLPERTAPIGRIDIETAFLLALPLLDLGPEASGICRLGVETSSRHEHRVVGVLAGIEEGRVAYCRARPEGAATAWVTGTVNAWFRYEGDEDLDGLDAGGDADLVRAVLAGLYSNLARPAVA